MIRRWMEITFILIMIYLVLSRGFEFSRVIRAIGDVYAQSVGALQGRD